MRFHVSLSVTALVGATSPLKAKVRYQQKALSIENKINIGIELNYSAQKLQHLYVAYNEIFTQHFWQEAGHQCC